MAVGFVKWIIAQKELEKQGYGGIKSGHVVNVFKKGTIKSATTGKTLYANGHSALPLASKNED